MKDIDIDEKRIIVIDTDSFNPSYKIEIHEKYDKTKQYTCNVVKINGIEVETNGSIFFQKHRDLININEESKTIIDIQIEEHF